MSSQVANDKYYKNRRGTF